MKPVRVIGMRDELDGDIVLNTTSQSSDWGQAFSPFFLGPVSTYDGRTAQNVENAWQFSKVYRNHVDMRGEPTYDWFDWRTKGWQMARAQRYPMGKVLKPLFSYWDGKKYGYVEARKHIYAPVYSKAVIQTSEFEHLKELYKQGKQIVLRDFDGYDHIQLGHSLKEVINNPYKKMGHAFVLAMLLQYPQIEERYRR